jgi:hypothetical protein
MKSRTAPPSPISEVLGEDSKNVASADKMRRYAIWDSWAGIVGGEVAAHARPARWQGNVLVVWVEHPTWIQELGFLKPKMMERLASELPKIPIKDIRFEVGELPPLPEPASKESTSQGRDLTDDELSSIEQAVSEIRDEETRESARRAMIRSYQSK